MQVLEFSSLATAESEMVLFFHGFPAVRSKQNRALAEYVSKTDSVYTVVPLYSGLGFTPGQFLFSDCLNEVRAWAVDFIQSKIANGWSGSLTLVGHSWGGFLSLVLANEPLLKKHLRKIVLMSPLVHFAPPSMAAMAFEIVQRENPHLDLPDVAVLAKDFSSIADRYPTSKLISGLDKKISVIYWQARVDALTPPEAAEAVRPLFPCQLEYQLVDQDHSFLKNREQLAADLAKAIRGA